MRPTLVLASASPRRRDLIRALGLPVVCQVADVSELPRPGETPEETALRLAAMKADTPDGESQEGVIVAGDTVVVSGGAVGSQRILGKPADSEEARRMLRELRGREHRVITGVCLRDLANGARYLEAVVTRVWMRRYSDDEVEAYIASRLPLDKAGAYGIQDGDFRPVERLEGCYLNVVGLPLCAVARGLKALGHVAPSYSADECRCGEWASYPHPDPLPEGEGVIA